MSKRKVFSSVALMLLFTVSLYGVAFSLHDPRLPTTVPQLPTPVVTVAPPLSIEGLLAATNSERTKAGSPALTLDDRLNASASDKCTEMVADGWGHVAPDGTHGYQYALTHDPQAVTVSENLAEGYATDATVTYAWMHSPPHREALLSHTYTLVGYGLCKAGNIQYVVQHFADK